MTLRTKEERLSDALKNELTIEFPYNLRDDGPLMTRSLPKILMAEIEFSANPDNMPALPQIPGWYYECFTNLPEAIRKHPEIALVFEARVWAVFKFLQGNFESAIMEIPNLGVAVVSRKELSPSNPKLLTTHLVAHWLSYALSPELWGPHGKWTRFHSTLHELFDKKAILSNDDYPGYYALLSGAEKLKTHGFEGTCLDKTYLLVLPWDFSLSGLKKLQNVVLKEF